MLAALVTSRRPPPLPTPAALEHESCRRLRAAADPRVATGLHAYFKKTERVRFFGLKAAALRAIEREMLARVQGRWSLREAAAYCGLLLRRPELEAKALGAMVLARHRRRFEPWLLSDAKRWLAAGLCASWATTDALSSLVIAEVLRRFPDRIATLPSWTRSRNLWVRRAAAVSLVPLARRGQALDGAYAVAAALLGDDEDLVHKATGWLLREAGRTDVHRLERFLLRHGPRLPRTALRYAIERLPAARRRELLARTRG